MSEERDLPTIQGHVFFFFKAELLVIVIVACMTLSSQQCCVSDMDFANLKTFCQL